MISHAISCRVRGTVCLQLELLGLCISFIALTRPLALIGLTGTVLIARYQSKAQQYMSSHHNETALMGEHPFKLTSTHHAQQPTVNHTFLSWSSRISLSSSDSLRGCLDARWSITC